MGHSVEFSSPNVVHSQNLVSDVAPSTAGLNPSCYKGTESVGETCISHSQKQKVVSGIRGWGEASSR
jgi:hypothetical protein